MINCVPLTLKGITGARGPVTAGEQPIAIVFDLMNPLGAYWRLGIKP